MKTTKAISELDKVSAEDLARYAEHWKHLRPKDHLQYYQRWVFAFLSVHTTWESNVRAYNMLKNREWDGDVTKLKEAIMKSGAGLHNLRTNGIGKFDREFWQAPQDWYKKDDESWRECRDRLAGRCFGLNWAKTAFVLEMTYPETCQVACMDAHMLKLYGHTPKSTPSYAEYVEMENHWVFECLARGMAPAIARGVVWDRIQNKETPAYWTSVFRDEGKERHAGGVELQLPHSVGDTASAV